MSFTALIFLILTTAFHNLRKIISRCPNSKKTAFSFLTVFTLISLFHNYVYSPELSRLFLWISSGLLIFLSVRLILFHKFIQFNPDNYIGTSYVFGGIILQVIGLVFSDLHPSELVQVFLLASVPLILYGFGFIALDNYGRIVEEHMNHIETKTFELNKAYDALYQSSHYDEHTGLRNRRHFEMDLERTLMSSGESWAGLINLNNFRRINELMGYHSGDEVIKSLSEQIHAFLPIDSTLYRMTGDRFAFIYNGSSRASALDLCSKIQHLLQIYSTTNELPFTLTAGIGVTSISNGKHVDGITRELELSMSTASHSVDDRHAVYSETLLNDFIKETQFRENLKSATKNEDWSLYFQPQIDIENGQMSGSEILIRWETKDGKLLSPGDFIPLAESIGLMQNIGVTVIDKSFQIIQHLNQSGYDYMRYAINLSEDQFQSPEIIRALKQLKKVYNIPDGQIVLEICETVFINDFESANANISKFKSLGFEIALDDFGTGYSSLQYLANLDIDEVKFDKQFVKNINSDLKSKKILGTMINLAKQLEIRHVIEGIESTSQLRVVETLGGEIYQGYYFSKPMDCTSLERVLELFNNDEFIA